MDQEILQRLKLKSKEEILARLKELIHRHRRRYLNQYLRPCPDNCVQADVVGRRVVGCLGCRSENPTTCNNPKKFEAVCTKEEIYQQFREDIRNPNVLLRRYRDLAVFFWMLGAFDEDNCVDEVVLTNVETRVK